MIWKLIDTDEFNEDVQKLKKSGDKATLRKLEILLNELKIDPYKGTGHPEPLKLDQSGKWSRKINKKHRLIYRPIADDKTPPKVVLLLAGYGHYDDK